MLGRLSRWWVRMARAIYDYSVLTTLLLPTRGQAWVGGADVTREPARVRRQLGFHTGSDASFYARLSARENLLLFASLNNLGAREAQPRIAKLSDLMALGEILDRQVRTLSTARSIASGWPAPCSTGPRCWSSTSLREPRPAGRRRVQTLPS